MGPRTGNLVGRDWGAPAVKFRTFVIGLVLLAAVLAIGLRGYEPLSGKSDGFEVLSLSSPRSIVAHEQYSIYGGLVVPDGTFEKRLLVCSEQSCTATGWGGVTGPGEWWGYWGQLNVPEGNFEVYLSLFPSGRAHGNAVVRFGWRVVAH